MFRRQFAIAIAAAGFVIPAQAADPYPSRPIKIVVTTSPGSSADVLARTIGGPMSELLGQPVVIENRPGARGVTGALSVARSASDGYTLLMGNASIICVEPAMTKNLPYDSLKDFAPVGIVGGLSPMFVVRKDSHIRDLADLADKARKAPGELTYGATAQTYIMLMEMFKSKTKGDLRAIPYRGPADAMIDILAGRIDVALDTPTSSMTHLKSGAIRPLAVLDPTRPAVLPDVPTAAEAGFPELTFVGWNGVLAPARTPDAVLDKLHAAMVKVLERAEVRARLEALSIAPTQLSRPKFAELIASDIARYTAAAETAGIRIDR